MSVILFWRAIYSPNVEWSRGVIRLVSRRCPMRVTMLDDVTVTSPVCDAVIGWSF